ncbi:hypothetical protein G9A89_021731 [Geosiphon pyriformis]|nr:hypothetical protein G9A89_021731 [Geosiphon pyriformis]
MDPTPNTETLEGKSNSAEVRKASNSDFIIITILSSFLGLASLLAIIIILVGPKWKRTHAMMRKRKRLSDPKLKPLTILGETKSDFTSEYVSQTSKVTTILNIPQVLRKPLVRNEEQVMDGLLQEDKVEEKIEDLPEAAAETIIFVKSPVEIPKSAKKNTFWKSADYHV